MSRPRLHGPVAVVVAATAFLLVAAGGGGRATQPPLMSVGPAGAAPPASPSPFAGESETLETVRSFLRAGAERRLPTDSRTLRETRKLLPADFGRYQTRRFIVLSDAPPRWTQQQAQLLDRTYHQFHRYARRVGLKPRPLRHKLVCVLFQEHADYRDFARTHDGVTSEWISGYYSPKHDRIVFYNVETNPEYARALRLEDGLESVRGAGRDGGGVSARSGLREEYRKAAIATTVHEAIHQLSFHTRIQSAQIQNPLWLSEGLATAFETDAPRGSFGPDRTYDLRERQFLSLLEDDKLLPLRELVTWAQMPRDDDDTIAAVYHQSYALMTWLSRFRRTELRSFFEALQQEPPGRPTPARHLEIFEGAFGDVDRLERAWLRFEQTKS